MKIELIPNDAPYLQIILSKPEALELYRKLNSVSLASNYKLFNELFDLGLRSDQ